MSAQGSNLFGVQPSPDSPGLSGFDGVASAEIADGTVSAETLSGGFGLGADFWFGEVLREEDLWKPLAGYFPDRINGHKQFAMWVALTKHGL